MPVKVAFIGAGSLGFTRRLAIDILAVPELQDAVFSLTDISARNLDMIARLLRRDIAFNKMPAAVLATTDRRKAIEGADYVINCTRIGGLQAFKMDIEIPLKYGVDQCVGDTLCVGGIMYGQRNIPRILEFCRDIRDNAAENALFLNYSNPNAMNTWAALQYGKVRAIGLCHGVEGSHRQIAEVIELLVNGKKSKGARGYRTVGMNEVHVTAAGINHQTWFIKVIFEGRDWAPRLLEGFERHPVFSQTEKIRIDILRRFGYYSTESNGHISEYLAWYRKRRGEIRKWIDMRTWIYGETGGYLRVCTEGRNWFKSDFNNLVKAPLSASPGQRSLEHGSRIIEALETGRIYRGHFNVRNGGCIGNLPPDAVVEVPCYADAGGINAACAGNLPLGCAAVCNASISVQRLAVEAAVCGDVALLKQAMLMDPLTGAVCTPPEIARMTDEMLVRQSQWLPQYSREIPAARKRFLSGPILARFKTRGAARLNIHSLAEMRRKKEEARRNALAADKGNLVVEK